MLAPATARAAAGSQATGSMFAEWGDDSSESNSATAVATALESRRTPIRSTVNVNYSTADGTATAGSDYVAVPYTTLTFAPGQTSQPVTVTVNGDVAHEGPEKFLVKLATA